MFEKIILILKYIFISVFVLLFYLIFLFGSWAFAANSISFESDVLDDLSIDTDFDKTKYKANSVDYSIKVIQIGESIDNELYIYTYQPSNLAVDLIASSINISRELDSCSYYKYSLSFINTNGVFNKYLVENFIVDEVSVRYYDISSIMRPFSAEIDTKPSDDNAINEIAYSVSQHWSAITTNSNVSYEMTHIETINITSMHAGFIRYANGYFLVDKNFTDCHYVSFKTDKRIDNLRRAYIYFQTDHYHKAYTDVSGKIIEADHCIYNNYEINYSSVSGNTAKGLWGKKYEWNRIETISAFLQSEEDRLNNDTIDIIKNDSWVLRFFDTDYTLQFSSNMSYYEDCTRVSNVSILTLEFETDGITYKLGVVGNTQSGDLNPDGYGGTSLDDLFKNAKDIFEKILLIIFLILFVVFLVSVLNVLMPLLNIFKILLKEILNLIMFPFKLIKMIFRKK